MNSRLALAVVLCLALCASLGLGASAVGAQEAPYATAFEYHSGGPGWDILFLKGWSLGATLAFTIENPKTPTSPDYEASVLVESSDFGVDVNYEAAPGELVTISGGGTTKYLTIADIAVTSADPVTDVVRGYAPVGSEVCIYMSEAGEITTNADGSGNWTADFSSLTDIVVGSSGGAELFDEDGDSTVYDWEAPTLDVVLSDMVADGRLPNTGIAKAIMSLQAKPWALSKFLGGLVRGNVITQQTMDEIMAMVIG